MSFPCPSWLSMPLFQRPFPCFPQAYSAAVHTQWQWIKQLCLCVEQHVKENAAYFQVFETKSPLSHLLNPTP